MLQMDAARIQETKQLSKDKTHEFFQFNSRGGKGGGLIIYLSAGMLNVLLKVAVAIPLPGQKILVNNWYLPPEKFLQRVGFSDSEFQTNLQQFEIICPDLNAHDSLWDPDARPTERGEILGETMLKPNGAFLNTVAFTQIVAFLLWMSP